jgi:hypothetical protein
MFGVRGRFELALQPVPLHLAAKHNNEYALIMPKSTPEVKKRSRGRPPTGAKGVYVKVPPGEMSALDAWIKRQPDKPSRPEALRRLAKIALTKPR